MTIGERIKRLREEKDLTQRELADKIQISYSVMNRIESGERAIRDEELKKIADVLETTADYLLGRTDQRNPDKPELPAEFETPEEAMKFILEQNVIMGFGGFDINKMNDEEIVEFANELLRQLKLISYKYKR
ncbi:helix-turn-helix domain-containing protein [Tepidimicrobium xylanilyticum]|uniref:Helix-turn-helix domain-containing protein n=1 Tax=Tepidimicrobium xylanilyticum TaxID=1123352 RepID=A0A1H3E8U6_9FIRM|nr:helix-turn-helix transcriptional regulator [Tepidimicrobium xylanilyticum]SDX75163.1 Helix-turn-helix domain-containing protein [Tepidimicrobium xylanilyticum]